MLTLRRYERSILVNGGPACRGDHDGGDQRPQLGSDNCFLERDKLMSTVFKTTAIPIPFIRHRYVPPINAFRCLFTRSKHKMSAAPLPPFDREAKAKLTENPNPTFTYGQKVEATEDGKKWIEGEKAGWTVIDPSKEEAR